VSAPYQHGNIRGALIGNCQIQYPVSIKVTDRNGGRKTSRRQISPRHERYTLHIDGDVLGFLPDLAASALLAVQAERHAPDLRSPYLFDAIGELNDGGKCRTLCQTKPSDKRTNANRDGHNSDKRTHLNLRVLGFSDLRLMSGILSLKKLSPSIPFVEFFRQSQYLYLFMSACPFYPVFA
jgi:hypothetical protein